MTKPGKQIQAWLESHVSTYWSCLHLDRPSLVTRYVVSLLQRLQELSIIQNTRRVLEE